MPSDPSSNKYLFDPESPEEMARLISLGSVMTRGMGGPLAGITVSPLRNVLDLGCGPGGWVLDVAFERPGCTVAGVDISRTMVDYANARARTQQLLNASFGVMDITQPLDFPDNGFDLVNARFLVGALPREAWLSILQECFRIVRPGGLIRFTETDIGGLTTSAASERFNELILRSAHLLGYGFSPDGRTLGITPVLPRLLKEAGFCQIESLAYAIDFSMGTSAWADFYRNAEIAFHQAKRVLLKTNSITPEEVEALYQQLLLDMHESHFGGLWYSTSFLGTKLSEA